MCSNVLCIELPNRFEWSVYRAIITKNEPTHGYHSTKNLSTVIPPLLDHDALSLFLHFSNIQNIGIFKLVFLI